MTNVDNIESLDIHDLRAMVVQLRSEKRAAYTERNRLVATLTKIWGGTLEYHQPPDDPNWDPEWKWVVFVDLPTGQATWHLHDDHLPMFEHLHRNTGQKWDGHTTPEKYERLDKLRRYHVTANAARLWAHSMLHEVQFPSGMGLDGLRNELRYAVAPLRVWHALAQIRGTRDVHEWRVDEADPKVSAGRMRDRAVQWLNESKMSPGVGGTITVHSFCEFAQSEIDRLSQP